MVASVIPFHRAAVATYCSLAGLTVFISVVVMQAMLVVIRADIATPCLLVSLTVFITVALRHSSLAVLIVLVVVSATIAAPRLLAGFIYTVVSPSIVVLVIDGSTATPHWRVLGRRGAGIVWL